MNKTQNGSGASNLKQEHYIKPEDKVLEYLQKAKGVLDKFHNNLYNYYRKHGVYKPIPIGDEKIFEIAKMIQLEEHREDK